MLHGLERRRSRVESCLREIYPYSIIDFELAYFVIPHNPIGRLLVRSALLNLVNEGGVTSSISSDGMVEYQAVRTPEVASS